MTLQFFLDYFCTSNQREKKIIEIFVGLFDEPRSDRRPLKALRRPMVSVLIT